jgi:hypothetical protein
MTFIVLTEEDMEAYLLDIVQGLFFLITTYIIEIEAIPATGAIETITGTETLTGIETEAGTEVTIGIETETGIIVIAEAAPKTEITIGIT